MLRVSHDQSTQKKNISTVSIFIKKKMRNSKSNQRTLWEKNQIILSIPASARLQPGRISAATTSRVHRSRSKGTSASMLFDGTPSTSHKRSSYRSIRIREIHVYRYGRPHTTAFLCRKVKHRRSADGTPSQKAYSIPDKIGSNQPNKNAPSGSNRCPESKCSKDSKQNAPSASRRLHHIKAAKHLWKHPGKTILLPPWCIWIGIANRWKAPM